MQNLTFNAQNEVIDATEKGRNDLEIVAKNSIFSEKFILENANALSWEIISITQKITVNIVIKCKYYIKWEKIKKNPTISDDVLLLVKYKGSVNNLLQKETDFEPFVRRNQDILEWEHLNTKHFSNDFIEEMSQKINWENVFCIKDRKSEGFIRRNIPKIEAYSPYIQKGIWGQISFSQTVSEQFLRDFQEKFNFEYVIGAKGIHTLSDAFVEDFKYVLEPKFILKNQKNNLSPVYLKEYKKFDIDAFYRNTNEEWLNSQPKYRLDWFRVSEFTKLSDAFVLENLDNLHIYRLASNHNFSEDFVRIVFSKIDDKQNASYIFCFQTFSQDFFAEFVDKVDLTYISANRFLMDNLSEDFIKKYAKRWDFERLGNAKRFSENFLRQFANNWDWDYHIPYCQRVSSEFLAEFSAKFGSTGWDRLSIFQDLPEDFIRKYAHKVEWNSICKFQTLSEDFIREFEDKINWLLVSRNTEFSESFKAEFADKIEDCNAGELANHFSDKANQIVTQELATKQELEKAFIWIEKALFYKSKTVVANKPTFINEVQRRILVALDRKEEAFTLIKWALKIDKKFKEFQSFYKNLEYLAWLKNNQA